MVIKSAQPNVSLNDFMQIMDVADALKRQKEDVQKILSRDEQRENIKQRLKAAYSATGQEVTDKELNSAIDNYFSTLYEFEKPDQGVSYKLATLYTKRTAIAKKYGIPLAYLTAAAISIMGITNVTNHMINISKERNIEQRVRVEYLLKRNFEDQLTSISLMPEVSQLPSDEKLNLGQKIDSSKKELKDTNAFLDSFCPKGDPTKKVSQSNYQQVRQKLPYIDSKLKSASASLSDAKSIVTLQRDLNSTKHNLEYLIDDIKNIEPSPPQTLKAKANSIYTSALNSIEKRKLEEANQYAEILKGIDKDSHDFVEIQPKISNIYSQIRQISKEQEALSLAEQSYNQARQYIIAIDIPRLKKSLNELEDINKNLNEEYDIIISGGKWRYSNEHPEIHNFYLLVKAQGKDGNDLTMKVKNEETGNIESVTQWGERVPEEIYEGVKADKLDNEIIDNSLFGTKSRGYLSPQIRIKDSSGKNLDIRGQITQW